MKIDQEGVENLKSLGKEGIEKKFRSHLREQWEKTGQIAKKSSTFGNWCCVLFMILFFALMVFSKMNEETLRLLGMTGSETTEVNLAQEDYYELLQVSPETSAIDIKKQYRKLADQYHPDRTTDETSRQFFLKLTAAYEVLRDDEKRQRYDETYGMGNFKNFIRSKTTTLTSQNFERLVTDSPHTWVIQVFDHDSYLSQSFSDNWEKLAEKYYFLKFGRIDRRSQQKLIPRLPFRPLEFPFLYVHPREGNPDFAEYTPGDDIGKKLIQTVKDTLPAKIQVIGVNLLGEWLENLNSVTSPRIIFLNRAGFEDVLFLHESSILESVDFHSTRYDLYGLVTTYLSRQYPGKSIPRYILIHPHGSAAAKKFGQVEFISSGYHTVSNRLQLLYPPPISRATAAHLCTDDHTCLLAPKSLGSSIGEANAVDCTFKEDDVCNKYRTLTLDQHSPKDILHYFSLITAGNSGDSVLAVEISSDKVAVVSGAKSLLSREGSLGLYEQCSESIGEENKYIADSFVHSRSLDDLLQTSSTISMVNFCHQAFSAKAIGTLIQTTFFSLFAVLGVTQFVSSLRQYRTGAVIACLIIAGFRWLQTAANEAGIKSLRRN